VSLDSEASRRASQSRRSTVNLVRAGQPRSASPNSGRLGTLRERCSTSTEPRRQVDHGIPAAPARSLPCCPRHVGPGAGLRGACRPHVPIPRVSVAVSPRVPWVFPLSVSSAPVGTPCAAGGEGVTARTDDGDSPKFSVRGARCLGVRVGVDAGEWAGSDVALQTFGGTRPIAVLIAIRMR
jgi:hypothetical protein